MYLMYLCVSPNWSLFNGRSKMSKRESSVYLQRVTRCGVFFHDYLVLKRGMALIVILFWSLFVCLFYATKMEIQRNIQRKIFANQVFFFWFLGLDLGCGPTLLSPDPSYVVCFCLSQSPSFLISCYCSVTWDFFLVSYLRCRLHFYGFF